MVGEEDLYTEECLTVFYVCLPEVQSYRISVDDVDSERFMKINFYQQHCHFAFYFYCPLCFIFGYLMTEKFVFILIFMWIGELKN